jgi:hypothetical protein
MSILKKHLWEELESIEQVNELKFLIELQYEQKTENGKIPKSVVYEVTFELIDYKPIVTFKDYAIYKILPKYVDREPEFSVKRRVDNDITTAIKTKGKGGNGLDSLWRGFIVYSTLRMTVPKFQPEEEWYSYSGCFKVRNVRFVSGEPKSNSQVVDAAKGTPDFEKFINALEKRGYKLVGIKPGGGLSGIDPQKDRALLVSWLETFVLDYYLKNFEEKMSQ